MQVFSKKDTRKLETLLGVKKNPGKYEKKLWEKVGQYLPYLSKIPGVLCICVGNSLAMNACHKGSDIDIFIITRRNRLWTTRIYTTLLFSLLKERKNHTQHAGKFCLSFFITEDAMDFSKIAIKNDIYLSYWIQNLKPILNRKHTFEAFQNINFSQSTHTVRTTYEKLEELIPDKKLMTFFGNLVENMLKTIFLPRTKKSFQKLGKPFGVVLTDDMLKFHNRDKRKEIRDTIFS